MFDLSSKITSNFKEAGTLYELPHGLCLFISRCLFPKENFSFVTFQLSLKGSANVSSLPLTMSFYLGLSFPKKAVCLGQISPLIILAKYSTSYPN